MSGLTRSYDRDSKTMSSECATASMKRKQWTPEEDAILAQRMTGTNWDEIMKQLPQRTRQAAQVRLTSHRRVAQQSSLGPGAKAEPVSSIEDPSTVQPKAVPRSKVKSAGKAKISATSRRSKPNGPTNIPSPTMTTAIITREPTTAPDEADPASAELAHTPKEPVRALFRLSTPWSNNRESEPSRRNDGDNQGDSMIDGWSLYEIRRVISLRDGDVTWPEISRHMPGRSIEDCRHVYYEYVDKMDAEEMLGGTTMDEPDTGDETSQFGTVEITIGQDCDAASSSLPTATITNQLLPRGSIELQTVTWTSPEDTRIWKLHGKGYTRREIAENFPSHPVKETMQRVAVLLQKRQDETFATVQQGMSQPIKTNRQANAKVTGQQVSNNTKPTNEADTESEVRIAVPTS